MFQNIFERMTGGYTMGEARKAIQGVVMYTWPMLAVFGINPEIVSVETVAVSALGGALLFQQVFGTPNDDVTLEDFILEAADIYEDAEEDMEGEGELLEVVTEKPQGTA